MIVPTDDSRRNTGPPASAKRAFYANPNVKPKPIALTEAGIPKELRAERRWVPWVFVWKGDAESGTWTKVPISAKTGRPADCNKRCHWLTFAACVKLVATGKADGVGYAFTGSGRVGLDLDDHRDPATGELSAFARRVLGIFPTYCEVSASGTGAKLIGTGRLPPNVPRKVRELGIELFDRGFFALTGCAVPGARGKVTDLQADLDARLAELLAPAQGGSTEPQTERGATCEEPARAPATAKPRTGNSPTADEIEARVRAHTDGARLMGGDTSAHHNDHSAADLALCNLLAYYAGNNPDLIDAVFRRSGLMREKWSEKHAGDGRTYGAMTVAKALDRKTEFFEWGPNVSLGNAPSTNGGGGTAPPEADLPPWPTMPEAAYHGLAGEFVRFVEPHTEADPVALLVQALVMFGSAAGRGAYLCVERTRHYLNEFIALVGQSAKGRKGTSEAWPSDLLRTADEGWSKNCRACKLASGEALVWALRDAIYGMADGERTCIDEGVEDKRLLITEGEFSAILKIAAKEQNTLSDQLRDAWDGRDLHNKAKGSPCQATNPHVSIIGHTNDSDLRLHLTENAMANGFANRFMFFAVRRSKSLPFGGRVDEEALEKLAARFAERLEFARGAGQIVWGADAAALWDGGGEYERLSRERFGLAGSLTSRAEAHVARLAMLYAVLDGGTVIGRPHLDAALAVWGYAEATAYRLFGGMTGDPLADDLLRMIRRNPNGIGRWALHQEAGKNIPAARIGAALATLEARALVRSGKRKTSGRDEEVWLPAT